MTFLACYYRPENNMMIKYPTLTHGGVQLVKLGNFFIKTDKCNTSRRIYIYHLVFDFSILSFCIYDIHPGHITTSFHRGSELFVTEIACFHWIIHVRLCHWGNPPGNNFMIQQPEQPSPLCITHRKLQEDAAKTRPLNNIPIVIKSQNGY